jgi:serine/threonine protein phosphatase PrpC
MGVYRSTPLTDKDTTADEDSRLIYAATDMQGWRMTMEDARITNLLVGTAAVFAVFDGHGGTEVSKFAARHFCAELEFNASFRSGRLDQALVETFLRIDQMLEMPQHATELYCLAQDVETSEKPSASYRPLAGCTAIVGVIQGDQLVVANAGDSRCVLARNGRALEMSEDHKPDLPGELARIRKAGGYVEGGRVNGNLNLSRSLGDLEYKRGQLEPQDQIISGYPEVRSATIGGDDHFVVLACDGVWDILTSQQCVEFVYQRLGQFTPAEIVEQILTRCLAPNTNTGLGCDNMTCILVVFKNP